jgi:hypothetical protein
MTPDERTLLSSFLQDLAATRGVAKDPEAEAMIRQAMSMNPDAVYLLVQHAIVADQSLHAAQARIARLEQQATPMAPAASSFLPGNAGPWSSQPAYAPPPPQDRPGIFSGGGGLGSFLRSAGTTAAGVAGGEMLFSGLSDMFGGHHGGGQGFFGGGEENVTINNYGDDSDGGSDDGDQSGY